MCTLGYSDQNNIAISNLLLCKNAQSLIAVDSHIDELSMWYIPGVPKKAEQQIFSTLRAKSGIYFYIIR